MAINTYEEAMQQLNERKAANRKALNEAKGRKESASGLGKKFQFAATALKNERLHGMLKGVISDMIRK